MLVTREKVEKFTPGPEIKPEFLVFNFSIHALFYPIAIFITNFQASCN